MDFIDTLQEHKLIAVLRGEDPRLVLDAARVLIQSGVSLIEVTFTVPDAEAVISELVRDQTGAVIGSGTVVSEAQIEGSARAGAQFLVSPGATDSLTRAMADSGIPFLPGVYTPSEAMAAAAAGATAVKLFPAAHAGTGYLRQLLAPLPDLQVVPSGGVRTIDISGWLTGGAAAVGLGSLATPADIAARDWAAVRTKAADAVAASRAREEGAP
ncbi:bifunctional 4-hydroxy-2-oxoglutarate aldolase/2-dehydro-3-deoxy-phosphogluconate aldolase [Arthrobacter sp. zg-Y820]|uniref:bifunctional 4-hydroxy-2-oxoglutarate aldolase/2-dehydro-3-deoxy-phosphogluconate aldolase n=1 Tax=unclassified Arthrobacter TaxID=235627 RepID=UPI002542358F|nr:bifunctional 4-hydroxy-2-oxoglutarate aldolase/2-dehydro-3-deoxy-phosphogluconate aldolase [Arthrobacter sp. zg.Y820]MCC9198527.1 bifunctional 4-hydroxy-2-oxoglutarate aldolase/2-dehydro-3-deoxy-phosphogluconate aldolase [Arthrobacter sp. zg-Y820]MDK1281397.1 bifunctional 4-hydroxy-2-oxoglutarate aldolase/2-dehydro-3-deoxy-phosphogluconate aldolase [Arthrobacter sp. zg.Y820]